MKMPGEAVCKGPRSAGDSLKFPSLSPVVPWPAEACGQRQETWMSSWHCHLNLNDRVILAMPHQGGWGAFIQHPKRNPTCLIYHKSFASFRSQHFAVPGIPELRAHLHHPIRQKDPLKPPPSTPDFCPCSLSSSSSPLIGDGPCHSLTAPRDLQPPSPTNLSHYLPSSWCHNTSLQKNGSLHHLVLVFS